MRIHYSAPAHVRDILAKLGRTEDVRFSPSRRRLAVASFHRNRIAIFDVSITSAPVPGPGGPSGASEPSEASKPPRASVSLTDAFELCSAAIKRPHGVDFIDDDTIVVANRFGGVTAFQLPAAGVRRGLLRRLPIEVIRSPAVQTPGSLCVVNPGENPVELWVCNNYSHRVTKHELALGRPDASRQPRIMMQKWLDVPDGVSVSADAQWIAISNHSAHAVYLYENASSLGAASNPVGILRGLRYPHGLRFTSGDRLLMVADAGAPYVHFYASDQAGWCGVRYPLVSLRALSQPDFSSGRKSPFEGGPKGIDFDPPSRVLVTSCEMQPLAFFDLSQLFQDTPLGHLADNPRTNDGSDGFHPSLKSAWDPESADEHLGSLDQRRLEVACELELRAKTEASVALWKSKASRAAYRRLTAPLRWASFTVRSLKSD